MTATRPIQTAQTAPVRRDPTQTALEKADKATDPETWRGWADLHPAERARLEREIASKRLGDLVALTDWGRNFPVPFRMALGAWCLSHDVDPLTELDNVGGPYPNADWHIRKLGEARRSGLISNWRQEYIQADDRLMTIATGKDAPDDLRAWCVDEHWRRLRLRMVLAVPENAGAACVTWIYLPDDGDPLWGVKWGGNGTSVMQPKGRDKGGGGDPNPVVEANAELSVDSQSIRRAVRKLAAVVPGVIPNLQKMETELKDLRKQATEIRHEQRAHEAEQAATTPTAGAPRALNPAAWDPYGLGADGSFPIGRAAREPMVEADVVMARAAESAPDAARLAPDPAPDPGEQDVQRRVDALMSTVEGERESDDARDADFTIDDDDPEPRPGADDDVPD